MPSSSGGGRGPGGHTHPHPHPRTRTRTEAPTATPPPRMSSLLPLAALGRRLLGLALRGPPSPGPAGGPPPLRGLAGSAPAAAEAALERPGERVALNNIADNAGATRPRKRVGRGIGSGRGKTSGRGHKGQKARSGNKPRLGFEGGQTPLRLRLPKRGFNNSRFALAFEALNLDKLERFVEVGRLDPGQLITMKTLRDQGVVSKNLKGGVKVLGRGAAEFSTPVHLEVSQASATARAAIEKAGGSVTEVYYNRLGLRALLKPEKFPVMIKNARPPPKLAKRFQKVGELPAPTALPE